MARIRSIKPEFFRHHGLYLAEKKSGYPLRIAFAGLWTAADREGRFRWRPAELKLDCLPHDEVDFDLVLDSLHEEGFVVKYQVGSDFYGFIPSWSRHQSINMRESQSKLPAPPEIGSNDASTPLICAHVHAHGEGKGKEGNKERNMEGKGVSPSASAAREKTVQPGDVSPKPKDDAYELWCSEFAEARKVPYRSTKADFVQMASLRKAYKLNGSGLPTGWVDAVKHYLSSPLSKYTIADLCSRYDVFVSGEVDRFGRPAGFSDLHQSNRVTLETMVAKGFFDENE